MDIELLHALLSCETDVDGALRRFSGDETLYTSCLDVFVTDRTMEDLDVALQQRSWDDAFTAAHALKGLAGNMGFVPLFHETAELVVLIRAGRIEELGASVTKVRTCYRKVIDAIHSGISTQAQGG